MAQWLRAGAVAAGMAAAMAMGAGVASADTDTGETSSATSNSETSSVNDTDAAASEADDESRSEKVELVDDGRSDTVAVVEEDDSAWDAVGDGEAVVVGPDWGVIVVADPDEGTVVEVSPDGQVVIKDPDENDGDAVVPPDSEVPVVEVPVDEVPVKDPDPVVEVPAIDEPVDEVPVDEPTPGDEVTAPDEPVTGSPQYPDAVTAPVTWRSMVGDVLRWAGLPALPESSWIPAVAVPQALDQLWVALRRIEYHLFNDRPIARPQQISQDSLTGVVTGSMNGTDGDGDQITYTLVKPPANGNVQILSDGTYKYTPSAAFAHAGGTDTFTVRVLDTVGNPWHLHGYAGWLGLARPGSVTVTVTLDPVDNFAPSARKVIAAPEPDGRGAVVGTLIGVDLGEV